MPINLQDLSSLKQSQIILYSPKFFDEKLTGRGGSSPGLLSQRNNPFVIDPDIQFGARDRDTIRQSYKSGTTSVTQIPLDPLYTMCANYMRKITIPDNAIPIANKKSGSSYTVMFMTINLHNITIEETTISDNTGNQTKTQRKVRTCYNMQFYALPSMNTPTPSIAGPVFPTCELKNSTLTGNLSSPQDVFYHGMSPAYTITDNVYWSTYSVNPIRDMQDSMLPYLENAGWTTDKNAVVQFLSNYEIYDDACARSELWQASIHQTIETLLTNLEDMRNSHTITSSEAVDIAIKQMQYIMYYKIPLDLYKQIYLSISKHFKPDEVRTICKQNLNLLLSDKLDKLNQNKANIKGFVPNTQNNTLPASVQRLSPEQLRAVMSTDPLILVQAGAGTGKSTLILARIDHLVNSGVNPSDITVLSFTNAAAKNIEQKNPNVHSMTIASMIHEIYVANFKDHELSTLDTVSNSLDIYYPDKAGSPRPAVVAEFQRKVQSMMKNDANNVTDMNNFIEDHYDEVISILDTIGQTTLELEIIICYQKIDTFVEPPNIASKYLIIDEVQDNSIFEFVYMLRYVDKHMESLFIVGDCSQTLYEFRASNPRALNILEGSGVFSTFQLNVNYRSNQEILDFANVALEVIEANQYAHIQLQANSLRPVTEQSFLDAVQLNYRQLPKKNEFYQQLPGIFSMDIKPYIDACLQRGEQVTVLSYRRSDLAVVKQILEKQYPGKTIVSLVPEKMYNNTIMTSFIKKFWDAVKFAPQANLAQNIARTVLAKLPFLVYNDQKALKPTQDLMWEWVNKHGATIQMWVNQFQNGQLTQDDLWSLVKDNMIRYEIGTNAIKQALLSVQNEQAKNSNANVHADFILSTIHSAKGLEFENVIVIYENDNNMSEEAKRMYYVALTRAMRTEYILAYDKMASPQIQADYTTVLQRLHATAPAANSPLTQLMSRRTRGPGKHVQI